MSSSAFFIGTSGWTYDHWKECFYPGDLAKSRWFDFYAARFNAVEVNATFYRAFQDQTYLKWKARAPRGFGYVLKAPRTITHRKLLRGAEADIQAFCRSAALLGDAFEMILLQVPPGLPYDPGVLRGALQAFPDPSRVAVEFRSPRWFNPQVESLLSALGACFCNVDSPRQPLTEVLTAERAYLRLHGREHWYSSDYSAADLDGIAGVARRLIERGARRVYIFFNNDFGGFAPANALALQKLLAG
ncbi:uncharacterized conserved protein [Longilinea arvoryzae]|uniref:Uncharacterized conserved protein n=1 Tax=Longilinea arvoryzae TaxID=360412 RepID=A0A0S7BDB2_9CHLR|nr:DUF72 domain-containing protein [Longilinea arvoryzae]GAP12724.1 uncharacterized conserved protein [Longilinea arvoryzae]